MVENTLDIGTKANSMEKVSILMQKEKKNTENGNMERDLDGLMNDDESPEN